MPQDGPCHRAEEPSSRKLHDLDGYAKTRPGNGPFLTRRLIQATAAGSRCNCYESLTYLSISQCGAQFLNCLSFSVKTKRFLFIMDALVIVVGTTRRASPATIGTEPVVVRQILSGS